MKIFDFGAFKKLWKCYHMTKSSFTCFLEHFILPPVYDPKSESIRSFCGKINDLSIESIRSQDFETNDHFAENYDFRLKAFERIFFLNMCTVIEWIRYECGKNRLIFGKNLFDINLTNLILSKCVFRYDRTVYEPMIVSLTSQISYTLRPDDRILSVFLYEISKFSRIVYFPPIIVYFQSRSYTLGKDDILAVMTVYLSKIVHYSKSYTSTLNLILWSQIWFWWFSPT